MSSYTVEEKIVTISQTPEVYLTETTLVIKDKEYARSNIRGCRVEEIGSFLETDLFYSNAEGPGKVAFSGLKWLLGTVGALNFFRDFTTETPSTRQDRQPDANLDADPPLYCLALLTRDDEIQTLPSINRLLLLDLAARINRELDFQFETNAA
jgi:hypothetical protein